MGKNPTSGKGNVLGGGLDFPLNILGEKTLFIGKNFDLIMSFVETARMDLKFLQRRIKV